MTSNQIIQKTAEFVKKKLYGEGSGHDWFHIERVWRNAKHLTQFEKGDVVVVELAALLHDISDWKFNNGDESVGPRIASEWLISLNVDQEIIEHVAEIIRELSFKGAKVKSKIHTIEGMIVQDADRLDALGAIGIARTFAYGGYKNKLMYDPNQKPVLHDSAEQYKSNNSSSINHFYEKLLLLKDLMNTQAAKEMAQERHAFMQLFLDRFYKEWEGKSYSE